MVNSSRWALLAASALALSCSTSGTVPRLEASPQSSGTSARLQAVFAVDERVVWASGLDGTYVVTVDGGTTWRPGRVPDAGELQFRDVHAFDRKTAFLLAAGEGEASRVYKTTDGGATWALRYVNLDPAGFLDCFDFWDGQDGVVYGDSVDGTLFLLRTHDGGLTWERSTTGDLPPAGTGEGGFAASGTCVDVSANGRAWVGTGAQGNARVLRSADGGASWTASETPIVRGELAGIMSVVIGGARLGFALGGDLGRPEERTANVARTLDGGVSWKLTGVLPFDGPAYGAAYSAGTDGRGATLVAVGPGGLALSHDRGETWRSGDNGEFWSVDFGDADTFWAVGPEGAVVRFDLR